jgi:mannitol-specific phosphotransferase system IIBC component
MDNSLTPATRVGTAGGTITMFIASITTADLLRTIILTIVGALVSFLVSIILKWAFGKLRSRQRDG